MKLNKKQYIISAETLKKVIEVIEDNYFIANEGYEYNNDDVMAVGTALKAEIREQNETN